MSAPPIASSQLKNGLDLICRDQSKKIAADRWYVCVQVEISIPVEKKWFKNHPMAESRFQQMVAALGNDVFFIQKKERNFVSDDEKEQIVTEMCDSALAMGTQYCSSFEFAAKTIIKAFADHRQAG